jgi:hypothetical protein
MAPTARKTTTPDRQWECKLIASPTRVLNNDTVTLTVILSHPDLGDLSPDGFRQFYNECFEYRYHSDDPRLANYLKSHANPVVIQHIPRLPDGDYDISVVVVPRDDRVATFIEKPVIQDLLAPQAIAFPPLPQELTASTTISMVTHNVETQATVTLQRSLSPPTDDQALWAAIRNRTAAIGFPRYQRFIDRVLCHNDELSNGLNNVLQKIARTGSATGTIPLSIFGPYAYSVLKLATQAFLTLECGVVLRDQELFDVEMEPIRFNDPSVSIESLNKRLADYLLQPDSQASALPYLKRIVTAFVSLDRDGDIDSKEVLPFCDGILMHRLTAPSMLELIWSYWQEEGMLVQTMNAIARRFQNRRGSQNDPLSELEFDALRPLNNLLWGYIQDEHNRLTVPRRAYEYHHHYGLSLEGKAVHGMNPADSRSKFIEAFHNLLYRTELFYREDRDTTMIADAFPLLNALKEVHLLLAEGAHNQFGDLTWTARGEMLIIQWMLARPEMREFVRGRYMVPYQESWMGAVDSMKRLQGWTDTTITHFHELAVTGERILLSIRYGDWIDIHNIEEQAKNWARTSKPEVQRYLHGYRTVTGVDLSADTADTRDAAARFLQPSTLLQRRLSSQRATAIGGRDSGVRPAIPASAELPQKQMMRLPKRSAGALPAPAPAPRTNSER